MFKTLLLQLKAHNLNPELEYRFHPKRKWRFDIAFPKQRLAIEYEGIMSEKSRHVTITGFIRDCDKYNTATILGWRILRFTYKHVQSGKAIDTILSALTNQDENVSSI